MPHSITTCLCDPVPASSITRHIYWVVNSRRGRRAAVAAIASTISSRGRNSAARIHAANTIVVGIRNQKGTILHPGHAANSRKASAGCWPAVAAVGKASVSGEGSDRS